MSVNNSGILCNHLWFINLVPTIVASSGKKGLRPKWTICKSTNQKNIRNMTVGNFGILSVIIVWSASKPTPAYVEACNIYKKYRILSKIILT